MDAKGRPVLEWEMNKNTGHVTETMRAKDGTEVQVREKDIDVSTLTSDYAVEIPQHVKHVEEVVA